MKNWLIRYNPGRMWLSNPNGIITYLFSFHSHHLHANIDPETLVRPCDYTSEQLKVSTKEGISWSRKRSKRDLVAGICLTVQVSEFPIKLPSIILPQLLIFGFEKLHQTFQVDCSGCKNCWGFCCSNSHLLIQSISRVKSPKFCRKIFKLFFSFAFCS